jgi:hypothetical protein
MVKVTDFTKKSRELYITPDIGEELIQDLIDAAVDFGVNHGKPSEFQHGLNLQMAADKMYNFLKILAEK